MAEPMLQPNRLQKGLYHRPHELTRLSNAMRWYCSLAEPMLHCFKWLKFHFGEPENSSLFAEFLVPIGGIIFLGL